MTINPPERPDEPDQSASTPQSAESEMPSAESAASATDVEPLPSRSDAPAGDQDPPEANRHTTAQMPLDPTTAPVSGGRSFATLPPPAPTGPGSPTAAAWGTPTGGPPPGYDQPRTASRLKRSSSDRVLTGVCGGLGRHTGIDPILFRIGFVALVFAAGTGILLYLALAVLMPRDDGQQIWSRAGADRAADGVNRPSAPAVPKGPRSPVPGVTLAVLLIGIGVIAFGERYGDWSLDASTYFAIAVATVGVALLVTAFGPWRRGKGGLIVLGLILSFALFVTSAVDSRGGFDEATFGERNFRPVSAEQIRDTYQVIMGQAILDLSDVQFSAGDPAEIQVNVTMGNFEIRVPRDADVEVRTSTAFGSVSVFNDGDRIGGLSTRDGYFPGVGDGAQVNDDDPELVLDVDVRFGNAEVTRVG